MIALKTILLCFQMASFLFIERSPVPVAPAVHHVFIDMHIALGNQNICQHCCHSKFELKSNLSKIFQLAGLSVIV